MGEERIWKGEPVLLYADEIVIKGSLKAGFQHAGINPLGFHHEGRERFQTVPYKAGFLIL